MAQHREVFNKIYSRFECTGHVYVYYPADHSDESMGSIAISQFETDIVPFVMHGFAGGRSSLEIPLAAPMPLEDDYPRFDTSEYAQEIINQLADFGLEATLVGVEDVSGAESAYLAGLGEVARIRVILPETIAPVEPNEGRSQEPPMLIHTMNRLEFVAYKAAVGL